ncbi:MAG TPA: hypothetical protein VF506_19645, partial [Streptosporangiaceae bacterium]
ATGETDACMMELWIEGHAGAEQRLVRLADLGKMFEGFPKRPHPLGSRPFSRPISSAVTPTQTIFSRSNEQHVCSASMPGTGMTTGRPAARAAASMPCTGAAVLRFWPVPYSEQP